MLVAGVAGWASGMGSGLMGIVARYLIGKLAGSSITQLNGRVEWEGPEVLAS
jgi:hypothetical protein